MKRQKEEVDEEVEIDSDFSDSEDEAGSETESIEETVHNKRLRLAKQYLSKLETEEIVAERDGEINRDPIAHRLQQDLLEEKGKLERRISKRICVLDTRMVLRGHSLSPTAVAVSPTHIYSTGKRGELVKWDLGTGKRVKEVKHAHGKGGCILALAVTSDGALLASGGTDKKVIVWDTTELTPLKVFRKHRDHVTAVAFRRDTQLLISGGRDRTLNLWNCEDMCYVESLYGHQDGITGMDSFVRERVLTVAGHDKTLRLWKIPEESQLVFNGHKTSIMECVTMLNEEVFVTGAQDNCLCVWHINKKRPIATQRPAHGTRPDCWVTAVAALRNTECFWSGSSEGGARLWACGEDYRTVTCIREVEVTGTINAITVTRDLSRVVLAVGQEHRLGRWWQDKTARNSLVVLSLQESENAER